jgi:rhomboid protease GluP
MKTSLALPCRWSRKPSLLCRKLLRRRHCFSASMQRTASGPGATLRLVTAIFLHFDIRHLVGNMSALLLLGPPLAATIGQLRFVLLFLVTGFTGNVVSQLFGDEAAVKAGASGGICGILGAMAGVALATMAAATDARERRPAWQTLGALAALFGMIVGFEPGRDHYAHLGGLLSGLAVGRIIGPAAGNTAT